MKFYNNLFSSYYSMLKELGISDLKFTAICLVCSGQFIHFFFLLGTFGKVTGVSLIPNLASKYYALIVVIPWFIIVYRYYSKTRVDKILSAFEIKAKAVKRTWKIIAIATFMLPIFGFPILFSK